jgi:sugar O-acyltransferase (sialic acid O-acetyltransferase NeuD family)
MKSTLFLCGAGNAEGVRLALKVNEKESRWENIVILDDDLAKKGKSILGVEIAGPFEVLREAEPGNSEVVNLVASTTIKRYSALQKIKEFRLSLTSLIDPNVDLWGVEYNGDVTIYQNVTFSAGAFIDEGSVVFTGAVIGHGCKVGKGCVIAPGAVLNARVKFGDGVYMGTNASILPDLKVGAWATIGINSGVIQDIPEGATAMGVPAVVAQLALGKTVSNYFKDQSYNLRNNKKLKESNDSVSLGLMREDGMDPPSKLETSKEYYQDKILEILRNDLKIKKLGIDDNLLDIGVDSLMAIRLFSQIENKIGIKLSLELFFEAPTVKLLANRIMQSN